MLRVPSAKGENFTNVQTPGDGNYWDLLVGPGPICHNVDTCYSSPFISVVMYCYIV